MQQQKQKHVIPTRRTIAQRKKQEALATLAKPHPSMEDYWAKTTTGSSYAILVVDTSRDVHGTVLQSKDQKSGGSMARRAVARVQCLLSGLPSYSQANAVALAATYLLRLKDYARSSKETYVAISCPPPQILTKVGNEKITYRVPANLPVGNRISWLSEQLLTYDHEMIEPFESERNKMITRLVVVLKGALAETTPQVCTVKDQPKTARAIATEVLKKVSSLLLDTQQWSVQALASLPLNPEVKGVHVWPKAAAEASRELFEFSKKVQQLAQHRQCLVHTRDWLEQQIKNAVFPLSMCEPSKQWTLLLSGATPEQQQQEADTDNNAAASGDGDEEEGDFLDSEDHGDSAEDDDDDSDPVDEEDEEEEEDDDA